VNKAEEEKIMKILERISRKPLQIMLACPVRHRDCERYEECLDKAIMRHKQQFSCEGCKIYCKER
jgi:hypothetical protein